MAERLVQHHATAAGTMSCYFQYDDVTGALTGLRYEGDMAKEARAVLYRDGLAVATATFQTGGKARTVNVAGIVLEDGRLPLWGRYRLQLSCF